jgi:hypothetical protein
MTKAERKALIAELKAKLDKWGHLYPEAHEQIAGILTLLEAMNDDH